MNLDTLKEWWQEAQEAAAPEKAAAAVLAYVREHGQADLEELRELLTEEGIDAELQMRLLASMVEIGTLGEGPDGQSLTFVPGRPGAAYILEDEQRGPFELSHGNRLRVPKGMRLTLTDGTELRPGEFISKQDFGRIRPADRQQLEQKLTGKDARLLRRYRQTRSQGPAPETGPVRGMVSPSTDKGLTIQAARGRLRSAGQQHLRHILQDTFQRLGGTNLEIADAVGRWLDGTENTLALYAGNSNDQGALRLALLVGGYLSQQKFIGTFAEDPDGPDFLFRLDLPDRDIAHVDHVLDEAGIAPATIIPLSNGHRVIAIAEEKAQNQSVEQASEAFTRLAGTYATQGPIRLRGTADFIGRHDRGEATKLFERLLGQSDPGLLQAARSLRALESAQSSQRGGRSPARQDSPAESQAVTQFSLNVILAGAIDPILRAAGRFSSEARKAILAKLRDATPADALAKLREALDTVRPMFVRQLTEVQLAAVLAAMRRLAGQLPYLLPPANLPPGLGPDKAEDLARRLQAASDEERRQLLQELPFDQAAWLRAHAAPLPAWSADLPGEPEPVVRLPLIEEAAKDLAGRQAMTRAQFDQLAGEARQKAFTVAGEQSEAVIGKIQDILVTNVAEGADLERFRKQVKVSIGEDTFLSEAHAENVFRTNAQTGFSTGLQTLLEHPLIGDAFPYREYSATHDDRVRDNHKALEKLGIQGTAIYRADDPVWKKFQPPWDFNDRCSWWPLSIEQAAERGLQEAIEWLRTGRPPAQPAWVDPPPFEPPPGFNREAA